MISEHERFGHPFAPAMQCKSDVREHSRAIQSPTIVSVPLLRGVVPYGAASGATGAVRRARTSHRNAIAVAICFCSMAVAHTVAHSHFNLQTTRKQECSRGFEVSETLSPS